MTSQSVTPPSELNALANRRTIATLWPQLVSGALFVISVAYASQAGTPTGWAVAGLAGLMFAICCAYLAVMSRNSVSGMRLVTWVGGLSLTLYTVVLSHELLPLSVLLIAEVAAYSVTVSSRQSLRQGLLATFGTLCGVIAIAELQKLGWLDFGFRLDSTAATVINILGVLGVGADLLQRFGRLFDRIERSVLRVQQSNEQLTTTQVELELRLEERTRLLDVTRTVHSTLDLNTLLDGTLEQLRSLVSYDSADVLLLAKDGMPMLIGRSSTDEKRLLLSEHAHLNSVIAQRATLMLNVESDAPTGAGAAASWLGVPLIVRGEAIGMLSLSQAAPGRYTKRDGDLALAFANQVAGLIFNAQLRSEAAQAAALAERNRIARDLHDSVTQSLFGISLGVRTAQEEANKSPERTRRALDYTLELVTSALTEMRALIFTLRPETLQRDGLFVALQRHIDSLTPRTSIPIDLKVCAAEPDIGLDQKEALFRIGVEATQNALKHAQPKRVSLQFICDAETICLSIFDDGIGFDSAQTRTGLGLTTMRERANELGGTLKVDSIPGAGTTVHVALPRKPDLLAN
jgi:signal transduction histidine kinase